MRIIEKNYVYWERSLILSGLEYSLGRKKRQVEEKKQNRKKKPRLSVKMLFTHLGKVFVTMYILRFEGESVVHTEKKRKQFYVARTTKTQTVACDEAKKFRKKNHALRSFVFLMLSACVRTHLFHPTGSPAYAKQDYQRVYRENKKTSILRVQCTNRCNFLIERHFVNYRVTF